MRKLKFSGSDRRPESRRKRSISPRVCGWNRRWQHAWPEDMDALAVAAVTRGNLHAGFAHGKGLGEEFDQLGIGLAVHGRGGDADFQMFAALAVITGAHNLVAAGLGLYPHRQNQRVVLPAILVLYQGDKLGFSWSVSIHGKARLVANGRSPLQEAERSHEC
jgi:hypothetical protein